MRSPLRSAVLRDARFGLRHGRLAFFFRVSPHRPVGLLGQQARAGTTLQKFEPVSRLATILRARALLFHPLFLFQCLPMALTLDLLQALPQQFLTPLGIRVLRGCGQGPERLGAAVGGGVSV